MVLVRLRVKPSRAALYPRVFIANVPTNYGLPFSLARNFEISTVYKIADVKRQKKPLQNSEPLVTWKRTLHDIRKKK